MRRAWIAAAGTVLLLAPPAAAMFLRTNQVGSNTFQTATLESPTGPWATGGCAGTTPKADLGWTATVSTFADGYEVHRSASSGGPYTKIAQVDGRTTTTYPDTTAPAGSTSYYVLRATAAGWTSSETSEMQATVPVTC